MQRFVARETLKDIINNLLLGMELGNVMTEILFARIGLSVE